MNEIAPKIRVAATDTGMVTYFIDHPPADLPAVRGRDLAAAWDWAREAAGRADWGRMRAFRFRRADGSWTDLALLDRDASCWAGAVDQAVGMQTGVGLSLCLRLLALVDLLAHAPWARGLVALDPSGAELNPALLRLAAAARLTDEARFDEGWLRRELRVLPGAGESR